MMGRTRWAAALLAVLVPGAAHASGYNIYEQGATAMGMAGAGTAATRNASAIFFNPAALPRLEKGTHVHGAFHLITTSTSFDGADPFSGAAVEEQMETGVFPIPNVYAAVVEPGRWALGAGVFPAFGLGVEWQDPLSFAARHVVTKADLRSIDANVTGAWAMNEQWSIGAGFDARFAEVELSRIQRAPYLGTGPLVNVADVHLSSDYTPGYGWNAGLAFVPNERWRFGATYRSAIEVEIDDGEAEFTQIPVNTGNPAGDAAFNAFVAANLPPDQAVGTTLKFPAIWSAGAAWTRDAWTFAADLNLLQWSIFDELRLEFEDTPSSNQTIEEDYEDAIQVRLGAEHRLANWTYRFGYYFDQHAAPSESVSPLLPDTNRHGVSVGFSFPLPWGEGTSLDLYELAIFPTRVSTEGVNRDNFDGSYGSFVNSVGVGLNLRF